MAQRSAAWHSARTDRQRSTQRLMLETAAPLTPFSNTRHMSSGT